MDDKNKRIFRWHIWNVIAKCWIVVRFLTMLIFTVEEENTKWIKCNSQNWFVLPHSELLIIPYMLFNILARFKNFPLGMTFLNIGLLFYFLRELFRNHKFKNTSGNRSDFFHSDHRRASHLLLQTSHVCAVLSAGGSDRMLAIMTPQSWSCPSFYISVSLSMLVVLAFCSDRYLKGVGGQD